MPLEDQLSSRLSQTFTGALVLCACVLTVVTLRREFFPRTSSANATPVGLQARQLSVTEWEMVKSSGHRRGPENALVTIVEFADFECPACRRLAQSGLRGVVERFPGSVAVVYRHWPLSYHRFAIPAARAAECAGAQGKFAPFADLLYEKQDSLGLKSFAAYAQDVGINDDKTFGRCLADTGTVAAVARDSLVPSLIGATGTPTLIVNGVLVRGVPDSVRLDSIIRVAQRRANVR